MLARCMIDCSALLHLVILFFRGATPQRSGDGEDLRIQGGILSPGIRFAVPKEGRFLRRSRGAEEGGGERDYCYTRDLSPVTYVERLSSDGLFPLTLQLSLESYREPRLCNMQSAICSAKQSARGTLSRCIYPKESRYSRLYVYAALP